MIIVFGSLNVDFVTCTDTLPRPGETVIGGTHFTAAGGKGANQASVPSPGLVLRLQSHHTKLSK